MKRYLFTIVAAAVMMVAFSCKKDGQNDPENLNREPEANEFCAEIVNGGQIQGAPAASEGMTTKAKFDTDGLTVKWQGEDVIKVKGTSKTDGSLEEGWTEFTCDVEEDVRAYFKNTSASPFQRGEYHAFYGNSLNLGTGAYGILGAAQTYNPDKPAENLPMYAHSTNHWLKFQNICAVLKIVVPVDGANTITVATTENNNGEFTITDGAAVLTGTSAGNTITITKSGAVTTFTKDEVVYVAVPAGTYHGLNVSFLNGSTTVFTTGASQKTDGITVVANHIYSISLPQMTGICFTARTAGVSIKMSHTSNNAPAIYLDYSTDGQNWSAFYSRKSGSGATTQVTVTLSNIGDRVYVRASNGKTNIQFCDYVNSNDIWTFFEIQGQVDVSGNILYLHNQDLSTAASKFTSSDHNFAHLFDNNKGYKGAANGNQIVDASGLILPNTVTPSCYVFMFMNCSALTGAPVLPAMTMVNNCYSDMFINCTSLQTAPNLPATTLDNTCYRRMFYQCSALINAPQLNATTLKEKCYYGMFIRCTSLQTAPSLPATTLVKGCYEQMFDSCLALTTAPVLGASQLVENCYNKMFYYCNNLTAVTMTATSTSGTNYLNKWLDNAGTILPAGVAHPVLTVNSSITSIPSGGSTVANRISNSTNTKWSISNGSITLRNGK